MYLKKVHTSPAPPEDCVPFLESPVASARAFPRSQISEASALADIEQGELHLPRIGIVISYSFTLYKPFLITFPEIRHTSE